MTLLLLRSPLPRGLPAGPTSALGRSTRTILPLRSLPPRRLLPSFSPVSHRTTTWLCFDQVSFEHLGEYFMDSPDPASLSNFRLLECPFLPVAPPPAPDGPLALLVRSCLPANRSEERRVGKECRSRWS